MTGPFQAANKQSNPLGELTQSRGSGRYTFGLALSAGLAGLLYGYDTVSISGAIDFLHLRYHLGDLLEGTIISSIMFGGIIGAMFAEFLADRYGRRRVLIAGGTLFFFASLLSALAIDPFTLIAARSIGGIGIGLAAALAVTYITESAPTHIRGTLAFSYQMLAVCGIFMTNIINYVIASHGDIAWDIHLAWRWMLGIGAVPAAVFVLAMLQAPESPRFLIQSGQYEKGFAVLEHIFGTDRARSLADNIADSVRFEREIGTSLRDLFQPGLRKALIAGIFLAVANQAIGMNVLSYYGPAMLRGLGFFGDTDFLASACVAAIELVFTVVGMYLIDAVGRKRLMVAGCALMCMFAIGISWGFAVQSDLITFIFVMLFTASFAFSMGPIPWIMIPELFPNHLRGRATGICTAFLLAANWAIAQFTPILLADVGASGTFLLFAVLDAACLAGVIWLPETMDRPLEDIELYWSPDSPQTAAQFAIHTADMKIRQAESMLALVENERMQALGIIEQAERDRVAAQKQLFALENDAMRRKLVARISAYQQTAASAALANQNTRYLDHVPGPHLNAQDDDENAWQNTAVDLPLEDIEEHAMAQEQRLAAMRAAAATAASHDVVNDASANAANGTGTPADDSVRLPDLSALPPIPERAPVQDEAELRRENAALRDALNSLDELIKNKH